MTSYLYVLGIGPVQGFISAARRTRDLWMGSHLLSEISKAAAREIDAKGGELIFPSLIDDNGILYPDRLNASYEPDAFNVANIIRAAITISDPEGLVQLNKEIQAAARKEWEEGYADKVKEVLKKIPDAINQEIWDAQVPDIIEFYAAWVPLNGKYDDAQKRVMRLFGSRKTLRNFGQSPSADKGWRFEKSSLDGARESVLNSKAKFPKNIRLRLRLASNEHLCAVGVTKRLGVQKMPFPSVVRIAIDPWIRGIVNSSDPKAIAYLEDIKKNCEGDNRFSSGTGARKGKKFFEDFPFDGQVFFPSRLEDLKNDPDIKRESVDSKKLSQIEESIKQLRKCKNGHREYGEPNPYFAILVADGDRMGKVISNIQSKEEHKTFSATLARFAGKAREIVENDKHHGVMVYAGGEDVLAFLPVDTCLGAARKLHDEFGNLLKEFKDDTGKAPTLSVGISIGHALEPLGDLIDYGHEAERDAKDPNRDGLAVHYHIRSGGDPIKVREEWTPKDIVNKKGDILNVLPLDKRLEKWIGFFLEERFPDGAAYDLRQLAEDYQGWQTIPEDLLVRDIERLLRRKQTGENKGIDENDLKLVLAGVTTYDRLLQRATELILTRKIAESAKQAQSNNQNQPSKQAHRNVQEAA